MTKTRIATLDSFRAIAILGVLFFHFFSRWIPPLHPVSLYPYNNQYDYFRYGYLGVYFFFIISGFVIFYTLENTRNLVTFLQKRMIRLLPSMVIASLTTFVIFRLFDSGFLFPESHSLKNLLTSMTFISPALINKMADTNATYLNGSYWSLWPEIQFYLFASAIFYIKKEKFLRNFILISFLLISFHWLLGSIHGSNRLNIHLPDGLIQFCSLWFQDIFNLPGYLPCFCIGALFYSLFRNKDLNAPAPLSIKLSLAAIIGYQIYIGGQLEIRLIYVLMFLSFFCLIYYHDKLRFLNNKLLIRIGACSYFLYLIHESIGILFIHLTGKHLGSMGPILPLLFMGCLIAASIAYTEKVDNRINRALKKSWL